MEFKSGDIIKIGEYSIYYILEPSFNTYLVMSISNSYFGHVGNLYEDAALHSELVTSILREI